MLISNSNKENGKTKSNNLNKSNYTKKCAADTSHEKTITNSAIAELQTVLKR